MKISSKSVRHIVELVEIGVAQRVLFLKVLENQRRITCFKHPHMSKSIPKIAQIDFKRTTVK